ncbi:transcriptional regulator [Streptomyces spiroverticillatus]|nr:transcriptional regulator [Streptomyces spiroverticillatus]
MWDKGKDDMPPRDNPTARQVRLGSELRKLRERAQVTARDAGGLLSTATDAARISNIPAGRLGISEERIRRLFTFYQCHDEDLLTALCAVANERRGTHWWDDYRGTLAPGFLDIAELEHHAVALRCLQPVTFPGLLQTEDYARALFGGAIPKVPADEVEVRVEHRMKRRVIFDRPEPPQFEAIVHEAALRMRVGGRKVAREQLDYLLQASEQEWVTLRVIPFTSDDFIEVTQTVMFASGTVPQLDTVHIDTPFGGRLLDAVASIDGYRALFEFAEQTSLSPEESRSFIHHVAREL